MPPPRLPAGRIPGAARLPRPPHRHVLPHTTLATSRAFTQQTRRDVVSPPLIRPQLPFLSPLTTNRPLPPLSIHLRQHFKRLISTERRDYYRRRLGRGLRIGLSFYAILVLFQLIKLGMYQEEIEHQWPTPDEWTWKSRWCLRSAQALMHPQAIGKLMTNWPMVAGYLRELLERLERPDGADAKGVTEQGEEGGFLVEGLGKTGLDVSAKSEPWRRGYHQALMGAAKAAENLEGWLTDRKQRISAPAEYVVGPSNPRPKPMPAGQKKVPREEDCEPASPGPEVFYMKILTTHGFDTRQKLDAALAYADYLDYKGLQGTARDMYTWAMDIAAAGCAIDASQVVDLQTGVLKQSKNAQLLPSENIFRVSTALAVHHARHNNLPTALSIFTSVLQARRALPAPPPGSEPFIMPSPPAQSTDIIRRFFTNLANMFIPAEYPAPLPSGNSPPLRTSVSACDEAGLMTYIGEILFASSASPETGLAWTRDAVDLAETTIFTNFGSRPSYVDDSSPQHKCAECLRVGLENWQTMVSRLVTAAERAEEDAVLRAEKAWFGKGGVEKKTLERKRWEAEREILDERMKRLLPIVEGESGFEGIAPNSSLFV